MTNIIDKQHRRWLVSKLKTPSKSPNKLCAAFLQLHNGDRDVAMDMVNAFGDTLYGRKRWREWERNATPIPEWAKNYMRTKVVRVRFGKVIGNDLLKLLDV